MGGNGEVMVGLECWSLRSLPSINASFAHCQVTLTILLSSLKGVRQPSSVFPPAHDKSNVDSQLNLFILCIFLSP